MINQQTRLRDLNENLKDSFVSRSAKSFSPRESQRQLFKDDTSSHRGSEVGIINKVVDEKTKRKARKICFNLGKGLQSLILLEALATHAFFEGIALGLIKDSSASFNIMVGLFIHKTAASLSLGISILKNFDK